MLPPRPRRHPAAVTTVFDERQVSGHRRVAAGRPATLPGVVQREVVGQQRLVVAVQPQSCVDRVQRARVAEPKSTNAVVRSATSQHTPIRYDTIRYGRLTCAEKLTGWPAYSSARHRNEKITEKNEKPSRRNGPGKVRGGNPGGRSKTTWGLDL